MGVHANENTFVGLLYNIMFPRTLSHLLACHRRRIALGHRHHEQEHHNGHRIEGHLLADRLRHRRAQTPARIQATHEAHPHEHHRSHEEGAMQRDAHALLPVVRVNVALLDQRLLEQIANRPEGAVGQHSAQDFVLIGEPL